jgi:GNAT superfamily N-acetyltransferase
MDQAAAIRLNRASLEGFIRTIAAGSAGARVVELDGVIGAVVPAVRERSVFSSVVYESAEALAAAREELAATYKKAGCAWTVWVPKEDATAQELLESAGHRLDAAPRVMAMELDGFPRPDLSGIEWTGEGAVEEMGRVNDLAYGYALGTFAAGLGPGPHARMRTYLASVGDEPSAAVVTIDRDGDCGVYCVATLEAARGTGLATALMRQALWEAAERGCRTTTLQATKMGRGVYERIGYQDFGNIGMWEWRSAGGS